MKAEPTVAVPVGHITIGGGAPICIQSMTDTDTADVQKTTAQIQALVQAGSEIVRVTVNNDAAAKAVPLIKSRLESLGIQVPIVGDFHYNGHRLLKDYPEAAKALDKYRINPGNVGFKEKKDRQFAEMIEIAMEYDKPVRIGVNGGSLDEALLTELMDNNARQKNPQSAKDILHEALILSALRSAEMAMALGLPENRIILSCKVSQVHSLIQVYQKLSQRTRLPLHLGLTEAGMGSKGIVSSSVAIGHLLLHGIGDTIRASLTPEPQGVRTKEVEVCQEILQALNLRQFTPSVTACPGCGRTTSSFFRELTEEVTQFVRSKMPLWKETHPGAENMTLAVMGCIVNGPGESKSANIGISLPGTGEAPSAPVFIDGQKATTLRGPQIAQEFKAIIEEYVKNHYPPQR